MDDYPRFGLLALDSDEVGGVRAWNKQYFNWLSIEQDFEEAYRCASTNREI